MIPGSGDRKAPRPVRVAFRSFGCRVNAYEASAMAEAARADGYHVVDDAAAADAVVFNTCSVTGRADQEARQALRAAHRANPGARLVVTGCYAQRAPAELAAIPGVAVVAGHAEKDRVAALLSRMPPRGAEPLVAVSDLADKRMPGLRAGEASGRTRAVLRVQDGCDAACTYCVIPRTRGRSSSLGFAEAVAEGRRLLEAGFREIVLAGTHLGHYGLDGDRRRRLADLVEALLDLPAPGAWRLRLSSVEPQEVDDKLVDLLASRPRLCPHLHLPLQSGSDPVLRAMRRAYRTGNYRRRVERIVARVPRLGLGADLMVGFPGETEADFRRTAAFLAELPFTHLHPFTFSPRPGTAAAAYPGRPPGDMAARRLAQVRRLIERKNLEFRRRLLGTTAQVLVEPAGDGPAEGWSEHYVRVRIPAPGAAPGRFALVRLDAIADHGMTGAPLGLPG